MHATVELELHYGVSNAPRMWSTRVRRSQRGAAYRPYIPVHPVFSRRVQLRATEGENKGQNVATESTAGSNKAAQGNGESKEKVVADTSAGDASVVVPEKVADGEKSAGTGENVPKAAPVVIDAAVGEGAVTSVKKDESGAKLGDKQAKPELTPAAKAEVEEGIMSVLADLDAVLGVSEEEERKKQEEEQKMKKQQEEAQTASATVASSPEALAQVVKDSLEKAREGGDSRAYNERLEELERVIDEAKRMGQEGNDQNLGSLGNQVEKLVDTVQRQLAMSNEVDRSDLKVIKDELIPRGSFYIMDSRTIDQANREQQGLIPGGVLLRGNCRGTPADVITEVQQALTQRFGNKYEALLVEDPYGSEDSSFLSGGSEGPETKVALQIIPTQSEALQRLVDGPTQFQIALAVVTVLLTVGSCLSVGVNVAVLAKMPPQLLQWLLNPANVTTNDVPPELEQYLGGPIQIISQSAPVAFAILASLGIGELAHQVAAKIRGVKLGIPFFVPSQVLGSLGGLTPLKSIVPNRAALWDIGASGPMASLILSTAIFGYGLVLSVTSDQSELVQVPQAVLAGSLLLGSLVKVIVPGAAASGLSITVHPLLVAGWAGIYTSALNLLPVGSLDGGRIVQATWGRSTLSLTSFFTYIGLALGFVGTQVALPFGLYVLILQRQVERQIRDSITEPNTARQIGTAVLLGLALAVLLPNVPDPDQLGGPML